MDINIYSDQMYHAELFGKPVLTANCRIPRETVPDGWYCYDMKGTRRDPGSHAVLVEQTCTRHSGTVLSPTPLMGVLIPIKRIHTGNYLLHSKRINLLEFCEKYGLICPENPIKFEMRPAIPDEAGNFFALSREKDEEMGTIGHLQIHFGHHGKEFWSTWHSRGSEDLNSPEFRAELEQVVSQLRRGVLKDLHTMEGWCESHGGEIDGGWCQNYGYVVETERYQYCLRCTPVPNEYQAHLTAFDLRAQEQDRKIKQHEPLIVWVFPTNMIG